MIRSGANGSRVFMRPRRPRSTGWRVVGRLTLRPAVHWLAERVQAPDTGTGSTAAVPASGVPVVAPRAGGAPEVVRHLETGLLHAPGSAGDLRRAVGALAGDSRRALMGARARELAEQRPWTLAVDELVECLGQQVRVPSLTSR